MAHVRASEDLRYIGTLRPFLLEKRQIPGSFSDRRPSECTDPAHMMGRWMLWIIIRSERIRNKKTRKISCHSDNIGYGEGCESAIVSEGVGGWGPAANPWHETIQNGREG